MIDTDSFIEQLIMKAIPDIDEKELEAMIEETQPVLYERVINHIAEKIDTLNHQKKQWNKKVLNILETEGVTAEVADYLKSNIPDFQDFLKTIYDDFETMYLKEFKKFEKECPPEKDLEA